MSDGNQRDELVLEQLRAFGATLTATTAEPIRTAETPAPSGPGQRRRLLAVGVAASVIALLVGLSLFRGSDDDPGRPAGSAPTSSGVTGPRREPEAVGTDPLGLVADGGWRRAQRTAATVAVSATEARPALRELYVNSDESIPITVHHVDGGTADGAGDVIRAVERVPGRAGEALPDPAETLPANVTVRGHRVASSFALIAVGGPATSSSRSRSSPVASPTPCSPT